MTGKQQVTFTIPASLPSGQYLMRVEQIALHVASTQFYIGCAQVNGLPLKRISNPLPSRRRNAQCCRLHNHLSQPPSVRHDQISTCACASSSHASASLTDRPFCRLHAGPVLVLQDPQDAEDQLEAVLDVACAIKVSFGSSSSCPSPMHISMIIGDTGLLCAMPYKYVRLLVRPC